MPIVFSDAYVLTDSTPEFPVTTDHPIVGWHTIVTSSNVVATYEDADFPASNLANPATHLEWRSNNDGVQYLTVNNADYVDPIDYLAIANHNLGSEQYPVAVEGFIDGIWTELIAEQLLADDSPVLFRYDAQSLPQIRLVITVASDVTPRARVAVMYVGKLLVLPRRIYAEHTPLPHARRNETLSGRSETGNFLGRYQIGAWRETVIPLSLIHPDWFRDYGGNDFLAVCATTPFFFGWRPASYPSEIGYCWTTEDPMPTPKGPTNLIAFDLKVSGVV